MDRRRLVEVLLAASAAAIVGGFAYAGRPLFLELIRPIPVGAGDIFTMDLMWSSFTIWPLRVALVESALAYLILIALMALRNSLLVSLAAFIAALCLAAYYPFTWYSGAPMVFCIGFSVTALSAWHSAGGQLRVARSFARAWRLAGMLAFPFAVFMNFPSVIDGLIAGFLLHLSCMVNIPDSYINRLTRDVVTPQAACRGIVWPIAVTAALIVNEVFVFVPVLYQALFYDWVIPLGGSFLFLSLALYGLRAYPSRLF